MAVALIMIRFCYPSSVAANSINGYPATIFRLYLYKKLSISLPLTRKGSHAENKASDGQK